MSLFARSAFSHPEGCDLDDQLKRSEATRLVQGFIDGLSVELRDIFLLCCVEGLSGVEVARLLCININTLYSREATARRRFAAFIRHAQTCEGQAP